MLVDEFQDTDPVQTEIVLLLGEGAPGKLFIVGDPKQSIYGFRGANVQFIRRFREDYEADVTCLVENYRSTRYIIEAANRLITYNRDRMKIEQVIRIDQGRGLLPSGGVFGEKDAMTRGRVALVEVRDAWGQAAAVVREIQRLRSLGATRWEDVAVL